MDTSPLNCEVLGSHKGDYKQSCLYWCNAT